MSLSYRQAARWRSRNARRAAQAASLAAATWRSEVDPANIKGSWMRAVPGLVYQLNVMQTQAAIEAGEYVDATVRQAGEKPSGSVVAASALVSDTRSGLLWSLQAAPVRVLERMSRGTGLVESMSTGLLSATLTASTALQTTASEAVDIAQISDSRIAGYTRYLVTPSCGRCVVLAGRFYPWSAGFQRHPRCDCQHRPVTYAEKRRGDFTAPSNVNEWLKTLSEKEQNRYFGKKAAEDIRGGMDFDKAINSNQGMNARGNRRNRKSGISELNSKHLDYAMAQAGGDRGKAVQYLRDVGLIDGNNHRFELPTNLQTRRSRYVA